MAATVFMEDSDDVATESTVESEQREVYLVDDILAQQPDENGVMTYLTKWQGYPLYRATWEPGEHFEGSESLDEWNERRERIERGEEEPFDLRLYENAYFKWMEEKNERRRRRQEKRRRRGLPVNPEKDHDQDEDPEWTERCRKGGGGGGGGGGGEEEEENRLAGGDDKFIRKVQGSGNQIREKRDIHSNKKRKGVANRITRATRGAEVDSSDELEKLNNNRSRDGDEGEVDSLDEKGSKPNHPDSSKFPRAPQTLNDPTNKVPNIRSTISRSLSCKAPSIVPPAVTNAPSIAKRNPTTNIFANWTSKAKNNRQRQRVIAETSNNSQAPQFKKLSVQRRHQLFSRNEPAPNVDSLTMIDPKTGKEQNPQEKRLSPSPAIPDQAPAPATAPATTPAPRMEEPKDIPRAYSRRTTPRPERPRSITPPSQTRQSAQGSPSVPWRDGPKDDVYNAYGPRGTPPPGRLRSITPPSQAGPGSNHEPVALSASMMRASADIPLPLRRNETCRYWLDGDCRFTAEQCRFAHALIQSSQAPSAHKQRQPFLRPATPPPLSRLMTTPKKDVTCWYWRTSKCKFSDYDCDFAHRDTGIYAPEPYRYKSSTTNILPPSNSYMTGRSPNLDLNASAGTSTHLASNSTDQNRSNDKDLPREYIETTNFGSFPAQIRIEKLVGSHLLDLAVILHLSGKDLFEVFLCPESKGGSQAVEFSPDRLITAPDMQQFCSKAIDDGANWPAGYIEATPAYRAAAEQVADFCRFHVAGLVYLHHRFMAFLYPNNADEWQFLGTPPSARSHTTSLLFRMFPRYNDQELHDMITSSTATVPIETPAVAAVMNHVVGFDMNAIFGKKTKEQSVYLAWPSNRQAELQILAKCFQDLKCRVYHSGTPGAWDYFRQRGYKSCLMLVHDDVHLWEIPELATFLHDTSARVFRVNPAKEWIVETGQSSQTCVQLFPHGKVTFLTDDVLVRYPEKATHIINEFVKANKLKPKGGENDKIAARPGLKDWLYHLAIDQTGDPGRQDSRWMHLYESVCMLCPPEAEDPYNPPNPLPSSHLVSIQPEEMPSFIGAWERNEVQATDMMVEWFAGWSLENAHKFRRFQVCYETEDGELTVDANGRSLLQTETDPRGWSKKYHHISVLATDDVMKQFKTKK